MTRNSISRRFSTQSILMWTIAMVLTLSPLWLGGIKEVSQLLFAFMVLFGFVFLVGDQRRKQSRIRAGLWVKILLAMGILALLQVVPLPAGLVALLSPEGASIASESRQAMGLSPDILTVSLQPRQTLFSAMRLFTLAFLFMIVVERVRSEEKEAALLCEGVVAVGLLVLVLSGIQTLFKTGPLLGTYVPESGWNPRFLVSSFINENHQAAFFNLTGFCALGVARNQFTFRKRGFYWSSGLLLLGAAALSGSRAGLTATVLGVVLYVLFTQDNLKLYRRKKQGLTVILGSFVAMAAGLLLLAHGTENPWFSSGAGGLDTKLDGMAIAFDVLWDYPILGAGADAFGDVASVYNATHPNLHFTHVENGMLQTLVDFGLIPGVVFLVLLGRVFTRICWAGIAHHEAIGPVIGLLVVVFQNLGDFSLSMPGVAIPAIVLLAVLDGLSVLDGQAPRSKGIPRRVAYSLTSIGMLTIGLGAAYAMMPDRDAVDIIQKKRLAETESSADLKDPKSSLESYLKMRPADAHVFYMEALIHRRSGEDDEARKWLNLALRRAPHSLLMGLMDARLMDIEGRPEDAANAYRQSFSERWGSRSLVSGHLVQTVKERAKRVDSMDDQIAFLEGALPEASDELLNIGFYMKRGELGPLLLEALNLRVKNNPDDAGLRAGFAGELLAFPQSEARAKREITQLIARHSDLGQGYYLQAMVFEKEGNHRSAWAMYQTALDKDSGLIRAVLGKNRMATLLDLDVDVRGEMGRIRGMLRKDAGLLAEMHRILSMVAEREGEDDEAILQMELATRRHPSEVSYWFRLAKLCELTGQRRKALDTFEALIARDPGNQKAASEVQRLKESLGTL